MPDGEEYADPNSGWSVGHLTAQMAKGAEPAWVEFHERYFSRLLRYTGVLHRGDDEAARESMQQTYLRVVKHVRRFDDEEVFWSWLTRVARTVVIDASRKSERYSGLLDKLARIVEVEHLEPATPGEMALALEDCLERCRPKDRSLLEKKYIEQWTYSDLAAQLRTTPKAIESRLARLRSILKQCIMERLRHV